MKTADNLDFHGHFDSGDFRGAAAAAMAAGHIGDDGKTENIVWSLNAGAALFNAGDKRAVPVLDTTEKLAQANDLNRAHAAVDYTYTTYDGVMTNMYKALAFVQQGDKDDARVEFNRVEERQRKAEELFKDEIAVSEAQHGTKSAEFSAALNKAQQSPAYADANAQLSELAAYAPFENPFATYMAGVFFVSEGDFSKGIDRLKRAAKVLGPNSQAASDVIWAEHNHSHSTGHAAAPPVWVVFENGQSATYHEMRIVLPMVTGAPMTLAMPVLALNAPAYASLEVAAGGVTVSTTPAGSFDAVMASEFNRRRPLILGEAVAEVLAKNVGSALAEKSGNPLLKLTMLVVANVSTADTRSWTALPK